MKLKDKCGCLFHDEIDLVLNPAETEQIAEWLREKAKASDDYGNQKEYHRLCDYFASRFCDWEKARAEKNLTAPKGE